MALRYTIDNITYEGGSHPRFNVECTVDADGNSASTTAVLKMSKGKTLADLKTELDAFVLDFAIRVRDAKLMENQLSVYIGQQFTVG